MKTRATIILSAVAASLAIAQPGERRPGPVELIESACVRSALTVGEALRGVDVSGRVQELRNEQRSIQVEILNRLEAGEIERGLSRVANGARWDANREAVDCLERNRHVAIEYLAAE